MPIEDEMPLRNLAWIESNRRKVDELGIGCRRSVWVRRSQIAGNGLRSCTDGRQRDFYSLIEN